MQFYDEVKISIESGRGGNGLASGRRESGIPFGGPNGGDGGKGGDIFFVASKDLNTLVPYKYKKQFKAEKGEPGRTKDQYGAGGKNLILEVPVGTLVKNAKTGRLLHHFLSDGEKWLALKGGDGGRGNIHFKSSTLQYPNFALLGEPGGYLDLILELQLLGDVALIGTPSVGKTSLINAVAHTKGKVAEYHFTTLIPNLGSVESKGYHFNIIDIPGLIVGASYGKGLGNQFLRHILKSRIFCFVLDISRYDQGMEETLSLLGEIVEYIKEKIIQEKYYTFSITLEGGMLSFKVFESEKEGEQADYQEIIHKKIIFLVTKSDLLNDGEILEEYKNTLNKKIVETVKKLFAEKITEQDVKNNLFIVSAYTHYGLEQRMGKLTEILKKTPIPHIHIDHQLSGKKQEFEVVKEITHKEKEVLINGNYIDEVEAKYLQVWYINHPEIAKLVYTLPWGNDEAELRFWRQMQEKGFVDLFLASKINKGDVLKIKSYYEGYEDKYIVY